MGKPKENHEAAIAKIIKSKKILFIEWIFNYYPHLKKSQFYNLKLHESETIREALDNNKVGNVEELITKWIKSDNATLQIAAMRLIADPEKRQMLNQQYIDHTSKGNEIKPTIQVSTTADKDELEKI